MIKPFTCLCLLAACGSGLYLYSEKHRTELLDRDIGRVIHQTEAAHARTGLLRAEWALLNEPGRLGDMAGRYLTLHPMAPTQFVQLANLSAHLPPAVAPGAPGTEDADEDASVPPAADPAAAAAADTALVVAEAALPSHHPLQPALPPATAKPDAHAATRLAARTDAHRAPHHVALADRQDAPLHDGLLAHSTPLPLAAPQPMGARVYSAMARPMNPQAGRLATARPTIIAAVPSYAPAVTSALGGGTALPPPVPYGR